LGRTEAEMEVVIDSNKIISAVVSRARGYCLIALLLVGARPRSEEEQLPRAMSLMGESVSVAMLEPPYLEERA
jgi:hypothetical protein